MWSFSHTENYKTNKLCLLDSILTSVRGAIALKKTKQFYFVCQIYGVQVFG